jgi:alpha-glucuronidase
MTKSIFAILYERLGDPEAAYRPVESNRLAEYRAVARQLVAPVDRSPTMAAACDELSRALRGLLAQSIPVVQHVDQSRGILLGTPRDSLLVAALDLTALGSERYLIRSIAIGGHRITLIGAQSDIGVLYRAFAFLRIVQTRQSLANLNIASAPRIKLRTLDHWDNLGGPVERGFAGHSIFDWQSLPDTVDPRLKDYARANASIGINGAVLNNVNADATILTEPYIIKTAAVAGALRPYGIFTVLTGGGK